MTYVSLQDQEFTVLIHEQAPQLLHVASSGIYSCGFLVPPALFHVVLGVIVSLCFHPVTHVHVPIQAGTGDTTEDTGED